MTLNTYRLLKFTSDFLKIKTGKGLDGWGPAAVALAPSNECFQTFAVRCFYYELFQ